MQSSESRPVSRPMFRAHRTLRRAFLDWSAGDGVTSDGERLDVGATPPPSRMLESLPADVEQVFLSQRPDVEDGILGWLSDPALWQTWEDNGVIPDPERFLIRLKHRKNGRRLTIYPLAAWFDEDTRPAAARNALAVLEELLREKFHNARVLPTPAQTGLDLWDRRRSGSEYPVLPEDVRDLIRSTSGQGRIQLCPAEGLEEIPGFYYYDARFAYALNVQRMPVGEPLIDERPEHDPYRPGRYEVRFRVPENWSHVGILPVQAEEPDPVSGDRYWHYPAEPGTTWQTWAEHSELRVAERFGWDYEIRRRILFDLPGKDTAPEPLKAWRDNLADLRAETESMAAAGALSPDLAALVSDAIRSILLQAIGSFHRSGRDLYHVLPARDLMKVPPEYEATIEDHGKVITYRERLPLSAETIAHAHPEWSSTIWAKTRANMLYFHTGAMEKKGVSPNGALTIPRRDVLAIRTDALYLARPAPWVDRGYVGEMRLKGHVPEPVPVPHSQRELNALRDKAEERGV